MSLCVLETQGIQSKTWCPPQCLCKSVSMTNSWRICARKLRHLHWSQDMMLKMKINQRPPEANNNHPSDQDLKASSETDSQADIIKVSHNKASPRKIRNGKTSPPVLLLDLFWGQASGGTSTPKLLIRSPASSHPNWPSIGPPQMAPKSSIFSIFKWDILIS